MVGHEINLVLVLHIPGNNAGIYDGGPRMIRMHAKPSANFHKALKLLPRANRLDAKIRS